MSREMTRAEHAEMVRPKLRAEGFQDCIHFAESWASRVDRLYDMLKANEDWPIAGPGLIKGGRIAVVGNKSAVFELPSEVP